MEQLQGMDSRFHIHKGCVKIDGLLHQGSQLPRGYVLSEQYAREFHSDFCQVHFP